MHHVRPGSLVAYTSPFTASWTSCFPKPNLNKYAYTYVLLIPYLQMWITNIETRKHVTSSSLLLASCTSKKKNCDTWHVLVLQTNIPLVHPLNYPFRLEWFAHNIKVHEMAGQRKNEWFSKYRQTKSWKPTIFSYQKTWLNAITTTPNQNSSVYRPMQAQPVPINM